MLNEVKTVLDRLGRAGWRNYLLETQGLDICAPELAAELSKELKINREVPGFEDFAPQGQRAIEPGDPARSLLYHALASRNVRPSLPGSSAAASMPPGRRSRGCSTSRTSCLGMLPSSSTSGGR